MSLTFFDSIKQYVGFTDESSLALREFHPVAQPFFVPIVDDFYAAIGAHPEAHAAITGGAPQIERLKQKLIAWLDVMLKGPHDEDYYVLRARIGRMHVRIALPQAFMFTAMDRIRIHLIQVIDQSLVGDRAAAQRISKAVHQILDLELAIMLETYREDLLVKNRTAERLATIGQFAASIGHELRNPLGVIESSLFLLRQHLGLEASSARNVAKHLERIEGEVIRANKTIYDVLDLALNRPPVRTATQVGELVDSARQAALLPASVELQVTSEPANLSVHVDADQVRQVLVNLFTNAAQAMPDGGHVAVTAALGPSGDTRITVSDDGPGIPIEARYRIFDALFTTKAKGSGLGLALCRSILEAHGGTIELAPSSTGAAFVLTIPGASTATTTAAP